MKIKKHQSGWMIYTPVYNLYGQSEGAQASSSDKKTTQDDMAKEYAKVIGENGLPVDVAVFSSRAKSILMAPDYEGSQYSKLLQLHQLANEVKFNNDLFLEAKKRVDEGMSGSDYALTSDGRFYVVDTDDHYKVLQKTAEQVKDAEGRYQLLSNNDLLNRRSYGEGNQFNSTMLMDVKNSVGMDEIMETVRNIVEKIGYQSRQGYVNTISPGLQEGFKHLAELMAGEKGLYEFKDKRSNAWNNIKGAVDYVYNSLNSNAKNTINAHAKLTNKSNAEMILSTLSLNTDFQMSVEALDEDGSKKSSKGKSEGLSGSDNVTYLQAVAGGRQVKHRNIVIGKSSDKGGLMVSAQPYPIIDNQNNNIEQTNIKQLLDKAQIGKIVDVNSISMGDQHISYEQLNRVMWDKSNGYRMRLPVDKMALQYGIVKPDLKAYEKFTKFDQYVKDHPGITNQQIMQKMQELGLNLRQDESGNWSFTENDSALFLATTGIVNDRAIDIDSTQWFEEMSSQEGKSIVDLYTRISEKGSASPSKGTIASDSVSIGSFGPDWLFGDGRAHFYKSTIFMPIVDTGIPFATDEKELVPKDDLTNILQKRELQEEVSSIRSQF